MLKIEWKESTAPFNTSSGRGRGGKMLIADVRFGIKDVKGREMGATIRVYFDRDVYDPSAASRPVGTYSTWQYRTAPFTCSIQACRDGKEFGAGFPSEHAHDTLEAAKADAEKRAMTSYKKVARKAAANGGVYA